LKRVALLIAAGCGLVLGGAGCGELPDVTAVVDLRVLAVKCEPAGFLVDLVHPERASQMDYTARITALVADPLAPGGMLTINAEGCPNLLDTITAATGQATKFCPDPGAAVPIPELATTPITEPGMPLVVPPTPGMDDVFQPTVSFGLTPKQVQTFFTLTGDATLDKIIQDNRDFGLSAIVDLDFDINGEHAAAIKNVVYWPRLDPMQAPNTNPTLAGLKLGKHRSEDTGSPDVFWDVPNPTLSISAGDKLFVDPDYLPHDSYPGAADQNYLLRVHNTQTDMVETHVVERELIRFQFYATAGTFEPREQQSELEPFLAPGSLLHTDSEYKLPRVDQLPPDGNVTIWVVTHDERGGSDWFTTTITVVP